MPTFEGKCESKACKSHGKTVEYLLRNWKDEDPECPKCGIKVSRQFSAPKGIWLKGMGEYCGQSTEGHWATSRDDNNKPVKEFIQTRKQQLDFCKRNGFYDPAEIPTAATAGSDGKAKSTAGEPGTWI